MKVLGAASSNLQRRGRPSTLCGMRYRAHACIILLSIATALFAADGQPDKPLPPAAVDALNALEAAKKRAQAEYDAAVKHAAAVALAALEKSKAAAMQAGKLDEANWIQGAIEEVKSAAIAPAAIVVNVDASKGWQDAVAVHRGDRRKQGSQRSL